MTGVLIAGLALLFAGLALLPLALRDLAAARRPRSRLRRQLAQYTLAGADSAPGGAGPEPRRRDDPGPARAPLADSPVLGRAVSAVERALHGRPLAATLTERLESAGIGLRAAEWVVLHVGCAVGGALLGWALSTGRWPGAFAGGLLGGAVPWIVVLLRTSRRDRAFAAALPDTLQLLAGSLRAGYALPQAIDAVTRESQPPISTEFSRALLESRLGLPIEDALEGIATRTGSTEFEWAVLAIRVQREVGGNLAELLSTVAATLRERERLQRQVRSLSAEGRLSAWVLALLPAVLAGYLLIVRPSYIGLLFGSMLGWLMLAAAAVLMLVGVLWLRRVARVEV